VHPSARVLVVDDDETISEFVEMALSDEGYDVVTAPHGAAALQVITEQGNPSLILLDMRMPVMDGWQFSREYRALAGPKAPIVVLTAAADAAQSAQQINADGYLSKPFDLSDLIDLVGRYASAS
jgi:two-component system, chemotaxis family, chemotaxis protein CheY